MATHETQNAQDRTDGLDQASADSDGGGPNWWSVAANLIIIGGFASFAVAFIGFLLRQEAVLVAGGTALAVVAFIWAVAATIALWKALASPVIGRLFSRQSGQGE